MEHDTCLILTTCDSDMVSTYDGVRLPRSGPVEAPEWDSDPVFGGGIHGLLFGESDVFTLDNSPEAIWVVLEARLSDVVQGISRLAHECKARRGVVVYCGDRAGAIKYLMNHGARERAVVYKVEDGEDDCSLVGGAFSTLSARNNSTLTGGDNSVLTGGDKCSLFGGKNSVLIGRNDSRLTGGDDSFLLGEECCRFVGGDRCYIKGGHASVFSAGTESVVVIGHETLIGFRFTSGRVKNAYGYGDLEPNTTYRVDYRERFIKVE